MEHEIGGMPITKTEDVSDHAHDSQAAREVRAALEPHLGDAARAQEAAVWAARTVASHLLDPADGVSLADPAAARHLVTTYFLPGFAPGD